MFQANIEFIIGIKPAMLCTIKLDVSIHINSVWIVILIIYSCSFSSWYYLLFIIKTKYEEAMQENDELKERLKALEKQIVEGSLQSDK